MKKKLIAGILALTMCFSIGGTIVACSDGENGKSAFELWLENGNEGTIDDFFAWLKGEKGDKGDQGEAGTDGTNGTNGEKGEDGVGIASMELQEGNKLLITYTDGSTVTLDVPVVNGEDGEDGKDGENGKDGQDGVGIANIELKDGNKLVITYTNNKTAEITVPVVNGTNGTNGVGIESITNGENNTLVITYTNGTTTTITVPTVAGDKGETGVGIEKMEFVGGKLVITYTDGSSTELEMPPVECTHTERDFFEMVEHTWDPKTNEFTNGVYLYVCNECGLSEVVRNTVVHQYGETKKVVAPTCTEDGYTADICEVCGFVADKVVDEGSATGHCGQEKMIPATCTDDAKIEKWCLWCEDYKETVVLEGTALGHDWKMGTPVFEEGAYECTNAFMTVDTCNVCNVVEAHVNQPVGHTVKAWDVENATAPTAKKEGLLTGTCMYCNGAMEVKLPKLNTTDYAYTESDAKGPCDKRTGVDTYTIWVDAKGETFTAEAEGLTKYEVKVALANIAHTLNKTPMDKDFYYVDEWTGFITEILGSYATCSVPGKGVYKCEECGELIEVVTKVKHSYGDLVTDEPATCLKDGYGHKVCTVCGDTESNIKINMLPHNFEYEIKATNDGLMLKKTCKYNCGTTWEPTPVKDYKVDEQAASCVAEGSKTYTCTVVNETTNKEETLTFVEKIEMIPHTLNGKPMNSKDNSYFMDEWTGITELLGEYATCSKPGKGVYVCEHPDCKATIEVVTKVKHTYVNPVVTTPATCTEPGVMTYGCSVCNASSITEEIPATGHTETYKLVKEGDVFYFVTTCSVSTCLEELGKEDVTKYIKADNSKATCKETAPVVTYTYEEKGKTYSVVESVAVVPHTLNGESMDKAEYPLDGTRNITALLGCKPTCTTTGEGIYVCDVCQGTVKVVLAKAPHNYVDGEMVPPTCDKPGIQKGNCSECGEYNEEPIAATGHEYVVKVEVKPTAESEGEVMIYCPTCSMSRTEKLPMLGNKAYKTTVKTEDTCDQVGVTVYTLNLNEYLGLEDEVFGYVEEIPQLVATFEVEYDEETHGFTETVYTWTATVGDKVFEYTGKYCPDCDQMIVIDVKDVTPKADAPAVNA